MATLNEIVSATILPISNNGVTAYLSLRKDNSPIAVSGTCTHPGCLLRANTADGRLECPCHRTAFAPDGALLYHELTHVPPPLPLLHVRQVNDTIEAFLPRTL